MSETQKVDQAQAQLLRRIAEGSLEAMANFYDQTATALFSVVLRILGDAGEAEEIIQDVFVQIWEKASAFDAMLGSAFHWALSIARHRAIDRLRARQRRARLIEELAEDSAADPPADAGPEQETVRNEESVAVRAALNSLPRDQRQAIELAFFGAKSHQEIAESLNEPLGTIKARIRRGMLKLRESLQDYS